MKRVYSPSQLGTWTKCQLQWFYRYIEDLKRPPPVSAYLGSAVDASVTANMQAKIDTGALLESMDAAKQVAVDSAKAKWKEEPPRIADDDVIRTDGECADQAAYLSAIHYQRVAPDIEPKAVQLEVNGSPDGYDFDLRGFVDIVEDGRIRDTKTTGRKPADDIANRGSYADQLTIYDLLMGGGHQVQLDYLVNTKKPYQHIAVGAPREAADHDRVLDKLARMDRAIAAGIFHPAPADSWQCSRKWCGYFDICPHGDRNVTIVPVSRLTEGWGV